MATTRHDRAGEETLAAHAELLRQADEAYGIALQGVEQARAVRDEAIRKAVAAGLSLRQIGEVVGLSAEGVRAALPRQAATYDTIGTTYAQTRRPDPRIRDAIWGALGDARSVVNVGAGTGSYEPPQTLLAVEPSMVMIAQRPAGSAPAAVTTADRIPLPDQSVDVALTVLSVHHWSNLEAGIAEMRRVARRVVIFTWDFEVTQHYWLATEYLPEITESDARRQVSMERLRELLGGARVEPVLVPHDCADGFLGAWWRRPEAYLDPLVRAGISSFPLIDPARVEEGLARLARDLESGEWVRRHADLLAMDAFDVGYKLVVSA